MHELAICQALLSEVKDIARKHDAERVSRIDLRIGPLSGVVPALLQHSFFIARIGTVAAESELVTESMPVRVRCRRCNTESEVTPGRLVCASCGDFHTNVISGDELLLVRVELKAEAVEEGELKAENEVNGGPHV